MNRNIYKKIAKKYSVSVSEVKRDMQKAVDETYKDPAFYARCVAYAGEKPGIDEFIDHLARRTKEKYDITRAP